MPEKIKPCPSCGSENLNVGGEALFCFVRCEDCRFSMSKVVEHSEKEVHDIWNSVSKTPNPIHKEEMLCQI